MSELPPEVRHMYDDSKEYHVSGDGACCLNCLAAWIYLNVKEGPALSRDLNTHMGEYREYYKDKISFPLTITLAGGERRIFDVGEEDIFFDTLVASPDVTYMWRGCADLIAIANLTKMDIEVVVYDQTIKVVELPTQQYKPDPKFPWREEDVNALRNNNYEKIRLLNYKNTHFNLILQEGHPLAQTLGGEERGPGNLVESSGEGAGVQGHKEAGLGQDSGLLKKGHHNQKHVESNKIELPCPQCDKSFKINKESRSHIKLDGVGPVDNRPSTD